MLVLASVSTHLPTALGTGVDGCLGLWTTPVEILLTALISFAGTAVICVVLQRIPRLGKYLIG